MNQFRLSIRNLIAAILFIALGLAAITNPSSTWAKAWFTLDLGVFLVAILGWCLSRGGSKAFWMGVCIVGWGFTAINFGPWSAENLKPRLLTTELFDVLYQRIDYTPKNLGEVVWAANSETFARAKVAGLDKQPNQTLHQVEIVNENGASLSWKQSAQIRPLSPEDFQQLCDSMLGLLLAMIGGVVARRFADRAEGS
jgi:hypothetical protein